MRGFLLYISVLSLFLPSPVTAHPGKTDRSGGHSCRKDCSVWDLYIGEYHHHDDYGRPLRVENKARPKAAPVNEVTIPEDDQKPPGPPVPENIPAPGKADTPASRPQQQDQTTAVQPLYEADNCPVNLLWLLVMAASLIVLLIALIIRRKKTAAG